MAHAIIICGQSKAYASGRSAGAYIIANVLRRHGITAIVLDRFLSFKHKFRARLIKKYVGPETRFICVSSTLMGNSADGSAQSMSDIDEMIAPYLDMCKDLAPNAKTIVGGSRITAKEKIAYPYDYAVAGQGEQAMLAIVNHELYGDLLVHDDQIDGTKYVSDTTYGYSGYNTNTYMRLTKQDGVLENEVLPLEFGRGCVFKCSYCNYPLIGKSFADFTRTKKLLIGDFKHNWEKFGINKYVMTDDTCNDSIEKAQLWHDAVIESGVPVEFAGYMRLELFNKHPEMAQLYLNSGLKCVVFGIETFNKEAGATMGKGFGEKAKDTLLHLKEQWGDNVYIQANFIMGLPHDTHAKLDDQFDWLMQTKAVHSVTFHPLYISNSGNSILDKEYQNYYEKIGVISHANMVMWKSPIMTHAESIRIAESYRNRWYEANTGYAYRSTGFQTMVLTQFFAFEMLKTHDLTADARKDLTQSRNLMYVQKMLRTVPNPKRDLPAVRKTPVINPGDAFVSRSVKRTIKINSV